MKEAIGRAISEAGIIPAVKDADALGRCLSLEQDVVFVLFGDICTIGETIETLHRAGKFAIVHADLIGGLSAKEVAADFLRARGADGVISTRPQVVKRGGELGMFTVLRFFVFDSLSLRSVEKTAAAVFSTDRRDRESKTKNRRTVNIPSSPPRLTTWGRVEMTPSAPRARRKSAATSLALRPPIKSAWTMANFPARWRVSMVSPMVQMSPKRTNTTSCSRERHRPRASASFTAGMIPASEMARPMASFIALPP